jgi:GT2 family glycosyltransferase
VAAAIIKYQPIQFSETGCGDTERQSANYLWNRSADLANQALVSVVIPNWNGKHWLQRCLPALLAQSFQGFEAIVVDNGSTDGSADWIAANYPRVQILRNQCNVGFAGATNQGIALTRSKYVATLNNDTEVAVNWLELLVCAAESDPCVGMWASKMLFADCPDIINSAGICLDKCGIAWDRLGGAQDQPGDQSLQDVFGPCGGAALYSRKLLNEVGLFDEDFFAYLDDVDLAWRARLAGWRCLYVSNALVYHHHSATLRQMPSLKWRLLGRNKIAMILKDYPAPQLYQYAPLILTYDAMMSSFGLLTRGNYNHIAGRLEGWSNWQLWWQKRKPIQQRRVITSAEWDKIASPADSFWAVRQRYLHLSGIGANDSANPSGNEAIRLVGKSPGPSAAR